MANESGFLETEIGKIPVDWSVKKIQEIDTSKEAVQTGPFGSILHSYDYAEDGVPLLLVRNIEGGRLVNKDDIPKVNFKKANELKKFWLEEGDIVFTRVGVVGRTLYITKEFEGWMFSGQTLRLRLKNNAVNNRFIEYYFRTPTFQSISESTALGTTRPSINTAILANTRVPLPPLSEQKAIASILGALDDKTELNRKMNETLEAMARAIFKSWFVDFDPIPCLGSHKEWQDSPSGKIPKGWRVGSLKEIAELQRNSINPMNFPNEIFDHYSIPAFDEGQMPTQDLGSTIKSNKFLLPEQCILISKLNPRIPRIWFPKINKAHRSVASTEFLVLIPASPYTSEFIYSLCISASFQDTFISLVTGTSSSHQRVKPDDLSNIEVVCPPDIILKEFIQKTRPLFVQIQANKEQSGTLASIRDALLPKLLSGEIRVKI